MSLFCRRAILWLALVGSLPSALLTFGPVAAEPKSSGAANGTLLIVGGGTIGTAVAEVATRHAGGPPARWVVIPTAQANARIDHPKVQSFIRDYTLLHARDRATADTEAFIAPLRMATAVWFTGGRQWRLADTYVGTRTEQALHHLLARGGLIAGSSAGASIMGSFLVRGSPSGNRVLMAPGHERGLGLLLNVAIDQHIAARDRESGLATVVAAHPEILGIGIDEGTAIVVRGNSFIVVGTGIVAITDGIVRDGKPYYLLRQGARFDLATWRMLPAAP